MLVVQTSYHRWVGLAGGGRRTGETMEEAAARELAEEVGLQVGPEELCYRCTIEHDAEYRSEGVLFYDLQVPDGTAIRIDNREIVWADFVAVEEALRMNLYPPVRQYLEQWAAAE